MIGLQKKWRKNRSNIFFNNFFRSYSVQECPDSGVFGRARGREKYFKNPVLESLRAS